MGNTCGCIGGLKPSKPLNKHPTNANKYVIKPIDINIVD